MLHPCNHHYSEDHEHIHCTPKVSSYPFVIPVSQARSEVSLTHSSHVQAPTEFLLIQITLIFSVTVHSLQYIIISIFGLSSFIQFSYFGIHCLWCFLYLWYLLYLCCLLIVVFINLWYLLINFVIIIHFFLLLSSIPLSDILFIHSFTQ